ncbi:MAG: pyruvate kinase [Flavobacteriales bacterium]|nr:pyruvate kinase [Flavobacteriales bacterium]
MHNLKKTKIVATLGPATDDKQIMLNMMKAGVNVFRINFSHADYEEVKVRVKMIRELNEEHGFTTAILGDLQGPKLRVGVIEEGAVVKPGDIVTFTNKECVGNASLAYMTYQRFPKDVKAGEKILLDDGKLMMEIVETDNESEVKAKVIQGGPFKSKKGVNLPNTDVSLPALTEKDINDAIFAITEIDVDWFALSFVRNPQDLLDLQELIKKHSDHKIPIIAKIEKPEAVDDIDRIIPYTDGIMVARGDLGVEIPAEEVPLIQKELVRKCKIARKPVIIATQMMETMIDSMTPTRAEVNDVANSVLDGADAVMLSGETSIGQYPVEVIEQMSRIIAKVEACNRISIPEHKPVIRDDRYITNSVCYNAANMTPQIEAKAITTMTNTGYTAFQISSHRPNAHILTFTNNKKILTMLNLLWGVQAIYYDQFNSTDETVVEINRIAKERGFVVESDMIINLTSMPIQAKGMVNTMRVSSIK